MVKQYIAKASFVGVISATEGELLELDATNIHTNDLLKAGLIEPKKDKKPKDEE